MFTTKSKWCGPPMPWCIENETEMVVDPPGWTVVEPTTALGGQQPAIVSTSTLLIVSGLSPTVFASNVAFTVWLNCTLP